MANRFIIIYDKEDQFYFGGQNVNRDFEIYIYIFYNNGQANLMSRQ